MSDDCQTPSAHGATTAGDETPHPRIEAAVDDNPSRALVARTRTLISESRRLLERLDERLARRYEAEPGAASDPGTRPAEQP